MKPATRAVSLSPGVYSAVEQIAREGRCSVQDAFLEAVNLLLQKCGKGSVQELDLGSLMVTDIAAADKAEDHWDQRGELLTKRLTIDLSPELYHRIKRDSARHRMSVPDAIRKLLESVYPEVRHG
jgi:hypothetical protein